jgi:hypothetical protein
MPTRKKSMSFGGREGREICTRRPVCFLGYVTFNYWRTDVFPILRLGCVVLKSQPRAHSSRRIFKQLRDMILFWWAVLKVHLLVVLVDGWYAALSSISFSLSAVRGPRRRWSGLDTHVHWWHGNYSASRVTCGHWTHSRVKLACVSTECCVNRAHSLCFDAVAIRKMVSGNMCCAQVVAWMKLVVMNYFGDGTLRCSRSVSRELLHGSFPQLRLWRLHCLVSVQSMCRRRLIPASRKRCSSLRNVLAPGWRRPG